MSKPFTAIAGAVLGAATWFLLFVILGVGLRRANCERFAISIESD